MASRKILVLHGSRQVGQLLVGRLERLRKKLRKAFNIDFIAIDGPFPHPDDMNMCQWWDRKENEYVGLQETLDLVQATWNSTSGIEGILGFSQGARLCHLLVQCHESSQHPLHLVDLQYVLMFAGFDAPIPSNLKNINADYLLQTNALHVYGLQDKLISPERSREVMKYYSRAVKHEHDGGHHVPMQASHVDVYIKFIEDVMQLQKSTISVDSQKNTTTSMTHIPPEYDDDILLAQQDEVEALSAIFPDEFELLSVKVGDQYITPIQYQIKLIPSEEGIWPPHELALHVTYPPNYPSNSMPHIRFMHKNNMMEFGSSSMEECLNMIREAALAELGMPSVLSCVYAAREFFESGKMERVTVNSTIKIDNSSDIAPTIARDMTTLMPATPERIQECTLHGLEIAQKIITSWKNHTNDTMETSCPGNGINSSFSGHGGLWRYTCGLVGKPSAGKSTFFNAATAFARQRNDSENSLGGATMAPHPFTTIDPNTGYCLVPAPAGSCPEDDMLTEDDSDRHANATRGDGMILGSTHGRDPLGRRLIPILLKDVAGLVPGAYQGRGRGNKFLNDLTDADVLIHVVDVSGTADTEGNSIGNEGGSHPLQDLAWILNELIEWVFHNVVYKWDSIRRRGRSKLVDMFSGYGQSQSLLQSVILEIEKFMEETEKRDRAMDRLQDWDEGDLRRLVAAFLGVRFPMALALNKADLPSSQEFCKDVQMALPVHGAHIGILVCARNEMTFVKCHILREAQTNQANPPIGVWKCLQSAMSLREPILVFPVSDMVSMAPLPGLNRVATEDASLPSAGMISCLLAAGGEPPTLWQDGTYMTKSSPVMLRDVLVMRPGSTIEDVYLTLKRLGALSGEFVRAEGIGNIGEKPKLVPKYDIVHKSNRILKIMTNKRREWQR
jgi:ribosome-binding ATPase